MVVARLSDRRRWGIIYCPRIGAVDKIKKWREIRAYLVEKGVTYDYIQSEDYGVDTILRRSQERACHSACKIPVAFGTRCRRYRRRSVFQNSASQLQRAPRRSDSISAR